MFFNKGKRLQAMEKKNKCPDCKGRGIHYFVGSDFFVASPINCTSCNGTGLFTEWSNSLG
ncbi:hypothetical protein [Calidifontibacillus oryziterrae]|uniref:hypothetical protein n=1 Tax=Calidifontibacillus oryziterrae TaxID=1191699 RepID=UPI000300C8CA|nr:hypothetical protein [Calidifontibacillus oryziterrae]